RGFHNTPQEITPEVSNFIKYKQIAFAKSRKKAQANIQNLRTQISHQPQQGGLL
ncbi:TPA: ATP-dependent helicase, partial [Proteus mirabilis]